jgi:hypothetical protein
LLKVLTGLATARWGQYHACLKGTVIGYLPQELGYQSQLSVIDEAKKAFEVGRLDLAS